MCIYFLLFFSDGFIHIVMFYAKCPLYCMSSNYLHPYSDFSLRLKILSSFSLPFFLDCLLPRKITFMGFFKAFLQWAAISHLFMQMDV